MAEETILGSEETKENDDGVNDDAAIIAEAEKKSETKEVAEKEEDKDALEKDKDSLADKPKGAPESYDDFTIPENMEVDKEVLANASVLFKKYGLPQDAAQEFVSFQAAVEKARAEKAVTDWDDTVAEWKKLSENDKEFGGVELPANLVYAKKAREAFGNDEFKAMLELTGMDNHPEMVRFLVKVGKVVSEDKILQGSSSSNAEKSQAQRLFPDMK